MSDHEPKTDEHEVHPIVDCPTVDAAALTESPYFEGAYWAAQVTGKKHFHLGTRGIIQWRLKMYCHAAGIRHAEVDGASVAQCVTWACAMNLTFGAPVEEMDGQKFADQAKDTWYEHARECVKTFVDEPKES